MGKTEQFIEKYHLFIVGIKIPDPFGRKGAVEGPENTASPALRDRFRLLA